MQVGVFALKHFDQFTGVLAQMGVGLGVVGDFFQKQHGQAGSARAAGFHVSGQMRQGAGDQSSRGLFVVEDQFGGFAVA